MGNIGAIVLSEQEKTSYKNQVLQEAGSVIIDSPNRIGDAVFKTLSKIG